MLKTFALRDRETPLRIAGPSGLHGLMAVFGRIVGRLPYPVELVEMEPGQALQIEDGRIDAFATSHDLASLGYALAESIRPGRFDVDAARRAGVPDGPLFGMLQHGQDVTLADGSTVRSTDVVGSVRPGRRVVFTGDTRPCAATAEAAAAADLLVHEATFLEEDAERAAATGHSTAAQAARLAAEAQVTLLALTHLSTRYTGRQVRDEGTAVFERTVVPRDFDIIEVPLAERGAPRLVRADRAAVQTATVEGA
jgi:ribonuclease Z